jgi:hypothetical protein
MARGDQAAGEQLLLLHMTGARRTVRKGHVPEKGTVGPSRPCGQRPPGANVAAGHPVQGQAGQGPATMRGDPSRADPSGYAASLDTAASRPRSPVPDGIPVPSKAPGQDPSRPTGGANVNGTALALPHTQISLVDGAPPRAGGSELASTVPPGGTVTNPAVGKKRKAQKTIAARKAEEVQTRSYAKWAATVRELDSAVKFLGWLSES